MHSQKGDPQNPTGNVLGLLARLHTDYMTFYMHFIHIFAQTFNKTAGKGNDANNPTTFVSHCVLLSRCSADIKLLFVAAASSFVWS